MVQCPKCLQKPKIGFKKAGKSTIPNALAEGEVPTEGKPSGNKKRRPIREADAKRLLEFAIEILVAE